MLGEKLAVEIADADRFAVLADLGQKALQLLCSDRNSEAESPVKIETAVIYPCSFKAAGKVFQRFCADKTHQRHLGGICPQSAALFLNHRISPFDNLLRTVIFTAKIPTTEKSEKLRYAKTSALLFTIVFMAFYYYGLRAVIVTAVSVFSSFLADYICCAARRIKFDWSDESPLMSGLLLALLMPATIPYTVMAFSAAFMAIVCKHAFGGNRNLIFCPVCIAYIFTVFCFPSVILRYPTPVPFGELSLTNTATDAVARSFTYYLDNGMSTTFGILDLVWGRLAGPMGSSAILIIMICAIAMYFFHDIPATAFFAGLGGNILLSVLYPVGETGWYAVLNSLAAGSYLFSLVFLACDLRYVPKRAFSQLIYGLLLAVGSYLIRQNTGIENSAVFTIPILCIFRDEFDRLSDALERLLRFLWKWTKIIAAFLRKNLVIAAVWLGKNIKNGAVALAEEARRGEKVKGRS